MNKLLVLIIIFCPILSIAQPYAPAAGKSGSTAIHKDSSCFIAWANGITLQRGYVQITDTSIYHEGSNRASFGTENDALGKADGSMVVSLGDSGIATLRFPVVIQNGPGFDFAVFENGFQDHYMEFAHVEVSSDGVHFVRFESSCLVPLVPQMNNFSTSNCALVNNLAGKYRAGYGTPFDLDELPENPFVNKQHITSIRLIDVIGNTGNGPGTTDTAGNRINDLFPTPYYSSGFDLDAVGVINGVVGIEKLLSKQMLIYPNPANGMVHFSVNDTKGKVQIFNVSGVLVKAFDIADEGVISMTTSELSAGIYRVVLVTNDEVITQSLVIVK